MPDALRLAFLTTAALLPMAVAAQPSLCRKDEVTEWSCSAGRKVYSLCASRDLGPSAGTLQYRAGTKGATPEFAYPERALHPRGTFTLELVSRGARLSFSNKGYHYGVLEPLVGLTVIDVSRGDKALGAIECDQHTEALTSTQMQNRYQALGIFR